MTFPHKKTLICQFWKKIKSRDCWEGIIDSLLHVNASLLQCNSVIKKTPAELPSPTYHVVPDKPVRYVAQSKTLSFLSPRRLPYSAVKDLIPPPVVMMATTGVCAMHEQNELVSDSGLQWTGALSRDLLLHRAWHLHMCPDRDFFPNAFH